MKCHEAKKVIEREAKEDHQRARDTALTAHLASCRPCATAMKVARLSAAFFGTLREEITPGPAFYSRLRERLAGARIAQPDAVMAQTWRFARNLVPALALGVLLLAGVTVFSGGSRSSPPLQPGRGLELYGFSLEEVNVPAAVERPSQDQMLAFVLTRGNVQGARSEVTGAGSGE
jgi:hypothetical protein